MQEIDRHTREFAAHLFNVSQPILEKVKSKHPEALFVMNDHFQLEVYTKQVLTDEEQDDILEDQFRISDKEGIMIHVLPAKMEDFDRDEQELISLDFKQPNPGTGTYS